MILQFEIHAGWVSILNLIFILFSLFKANDNGVYLQGN